ncbi:MAG: SpoIIE family protein phosphatase [Candidatus Aminicenantes bacterium]|nr:SpoIIE family protein phosphatase [Candidatus Aminicenantes bacterium]NIM80104.1 SpoIIE family protein phosphatase [Candidatus Aminicenantes bacterium]NIN19442.1 SpoIIE family protein phosphatase [Candidatus Aminicenantes bacterium]NIN43342.1 SpoIIE family protein phosphatase [Candidatus Aminicenantes bacterium]NIN86086.1 SpoIIE family protein phosphatase [Candidatus Aminicenantes bacterium]
MKRSIKNSLGMTFHGVILLLVFISNLWAMRMREIQFKQISLDQGLSQATVYCILQDSKGFMWFGTQDGLNRYDGYQFNVFKPHPEDPTTISHIMISSLVEDKSGQLWIGTRGGGLNRFNCENETFTHYLYNKNDPFSLSSNHVTSLCQDRFGQLWVGTYYNGINRFDPKTETFTRYTVNSPAGLVKNLVYCIYEDRADVLWVGTEGGVLHKYNPQTNRFTPYRLNPADRDDDNSTIISAIYEDTSGNFWVGADPDGLHQFNRTTETFIPFPVDTSKTRNLNSNSISTILESRPGDFWIGTRGAGLTRFDRKTKTITHYLHNSDNPDSLSSNFVLSSCEDRSGMLWLGTAGGGINQFTCTNEKFTHYHAIPNEANSLKNNMVWAICQDRDGITWIGTQGGGLTKFNRQQNKYTHYLAAVSPPGTPDENSISGDIVRAIYEDSRRILWVGTDGYGLNAFDRKTEIFTHYRFEPGNPTSISSDTIYCILQDSSDVLWIGTWGGGINAFNPQNKTFTRFQYQDQNPNSLSSNLVYSIIEDPSGVLWITTTRGLNRFDPKTTPPSITYYRHIPGNPNSLSNNIVTAIYQDHSGIIWAGTIGGGLNRFDPVKKTFKHYNETHGLSNNVIYGILADKTGRLWISTNKGLSRFNPGKGEFRNYDVHDGLQSNEFNGRAYYKSSSGEMFFGGVNGFNAFFPEKIKDNPFIPPIVITDFQISNRPVKIAKKGETPLPKSISETQEIELSHRHNVFSFEFAALSYINPQKNQYAYKMEGFDNDWIYSGTRRFVTYTNLNPGKYVFRVRGSNNDGIWNESGIAVKVVIHPPYWKTIWAYGIYALLLVGILYAIRRFELQREGAKMELRETELKARAMEARASAIKAENERKTHELEEARNFQLAMLPETIPDYPGLEIAAYLETAVEVGGDYYDFHLGENNALAIAVGDATGHGLKAATMVSVIKGLFCADEYQLDFKSFFQRVNHTIRHMRLKNLYMALTIMEIDKNHVQFSSAAMPPTLLYRAKHKKIEKFTLKGMPLGACPECNYQQREITLQKGDILLLYSDGLPELFNSKGEMFGYDRVERLFAEKTECKPQEIIHHLVKAGENWLQGKPQDDDITFVVIKCK